ncbi:hypothetical protein M9458_010847, partial [Cirrhinus mrigala]
VDFPLLHYPDWEMVSSQEIRRTRPLQTLTLTSTLEHWNIYRRRKLRQKSESSEHHPGLY